MTFVVTDDCTLCYDCVESCPADCFHEGASMLAINPEECSDCGNCELDCEHGAILPDSDADADDWVPINAEMVKTSPQRLPE
ncbi:MAG: ferredoxin family protein [Halopseudomonas sp.]